MNKKYPIVLTEAERSELKAIVNSGTHNARVIKRANALLFTDEGLSHSVAAKQARLTEATMSHIAQRLNEGRLAKALYDAPRPGAASKFSADDEARITAIACSQAPDGRSKWTLRLLAAKVVELEITDSVVPATIRRVLKKTNSRRTKRSNGASGR
jgi:transposase